MKKIFYGAILFFIVFIVWMQADAKPKNDKIERNESKDEVVFEYYIQGDDINFWGDTLDEVKHQKNLRDGVNCPRARFTVRGKKMDWAYRLTFDPSEVRVREAYLRYEEYDFFNILIGQTKTPYNFWFMTSIPVLNFMERALPSNAFNPGFRTQLQTQFFKDPFTLSLALVGPEVNNTIQNNNLKGHTPLAAAGRFTLSPLHNEKEALHFAVAGIFQDTDSLGRFRFRSFPEIQTSHNHALVDTGFIYHCKNYIGEELEAVSILGPLTLSGEFFHTVVNRNPVDLNFEGFYLTADYFLTGENYIYHFKEGATKEISKINHSYGAWQVAVRYSELNLDSHDIHGGREYNTTFGLNWILSQKLRFILNYVHVNTIPSDNGLNRHVNILALRCQFGASSE